MEPYIYIDKELARLNKADIEATDTTIYLTFPPLSPHQSTRLVLKNPKTEKSVRRVYIPMTLAEELRAYKAAQGDMGHSSSKLLLDTYADAVDTNHQKFAAGMESQLYASEESKKPKKKKRGRKQETDRPRTDESA